MSLTPRLICHFIRNSELWLEVFELGLSLTGGRQHMAIRIMMRISNSNKNQISTTNNTTAFTRGPPTTLPVERKQILYLVSHQGVSFLVTRNNHQIKLYTAHIKSESDNGVSVEWSVESIECKGQGW